MMPNPLSAISFMPSPSGGGGGGGGNSIGGFDKPLNITNSFGSDGSLSTSLPMRGVDIGTPGDFWADLQRMMALRGGGAGGGSPRRGLDQKVTHAQRTQGPRESGARTPQARAMGAGYYSFPGNSTSGVLNMLKPGGPRSAGAHVFSTGAV